MRVVRPASLSLAAAALLVGVAAAPPVRPADPAPAAAGAAAAPAGRDTQPDDRALTVGDLPEASTAPDAARRAAALHHQAMEAAHAGKWRRAATLHRRAAAQRTADDGGGARCLELAGTMLYADGDLRGARGVLEAAGDQASARGEVAIAADAYLKAGIVARDLGDAAGASALTRRAHLLARSPHLTAAERAAILERIVDR